MEFCIDKQYYSLKDALRTEALQVGVKSSRTGAQQRAQQHQMVPHHCTRLLPYRNPSLEYANHCHPLPCVLSMYHILSTSRVI